MVFTGAFSEGKTTIASAWLGEVLENIDSAESTDEIKTHRPKNDNETELVDTPGLFGFKDKEGEKFKDITKKYLSEADIVLWVMDPSNPIPSTHEECLKWLLRELNLLPRTIFVLSKFDEVATLNNDKDFKRQFDTKKEVVAQSLQRMLNLSADEIKNLSIVAVSANPFEKGLKEHWFKPENKEEFLTLSRINELQNATTQCIKQNGELENIVREAQGSIVANILEKLESISDEQRQVEKKSIELSEVVKNLTDETNRVKEKIKDTRLRLLDFVTKYFSGLIQRASDTNIKTFNGFFWREIGDDALLVTNEVQQNFAPETNEIVKTLKINLDRFSTELSDFEKILKGARNYGKGELTAFKMTGGFDSAKILAYRDAIKNTLNTLNINVLDEFLKFKPYGAINLANKTNLALPILQLLFEAWDSWDEYKKEQKFKKVQNDTIEMLRKQRDYLLNLIKGDKLFPQHAQLTEILQSTTKDLQTLQNYKQDFDGWVEQGKIIEAEFEEIKALEYKG